MGGLMWAKVDNYQDVQQSKFIRNWNTSKAEVRDLIGEHFADFSIFQTLDTPVSSMRGWRATAGTNTMLGLGASR